MPFQYPLAVLDDAALADRDQELERDGIRLLVGSIVDMAGVARAKAVPVRRAAAFHRAGVGASPSWSVFCVDNHIAFLPDLGFVGDHRLRVDLDAVRPVGGGTAWAPAELFDQDGQPVDVCTRGRLRQLVVAAQRKELDVLVGAELEFVLVPFSGSAGPEIGWQSYGLGALMEAEDFVHGVEKALRTAGLGLEQIHAEFGERQFEVSLAPTDPLTAADQVVAARLLIGRVARDHGCRASFAPMLSLGGAGNGAHLHMSFAERDRPLFSGGPGPRGLTESGQALLAGIVRGLPDLIPIFAGSVLSAARLKPDLWSGAYSGWGLENREAAVRLCADTVGNPYGANVELKCVDPSANPYLAVATMLGLALHGLEEGLVLPDEVTGKPSELTADGARNAAAESLGGDLGARLNRFEASGLARDLLGAQIVEATVAVRRYEYSLLTGDFDDLAARLCFAWSC